MKIMIINGPNLNLLGKRQTDIYGAESFDSYFKILQNDFPEINLQYYQSNSEGALIDKIQKVGYDYDGIVINPAAYTHYSYAIADAIAAISAPTVEVHISDIDKREDFRKISVTAPYCMAQIKGKGLEGYKEAIQLILKKSNS